jgi:hypothetical protein
VNAGRFHFVPERSAAERCPIQQLRQLEVRRIGMGLGDDLAALAEVLEVKEDGAAQILLDFAAGAAV